MDCRLKCESPEKIVYTMTITASAGDWERLRNQLKTEWPSWELVQQIDSLLKQARRVYFPEPTKNGPQEQ